MRILLLVLGLLAMASGGLKFRDRVRTRIGTSPFSLAELGLGVGACLTAALAAEASSLHQFVTTLTLLALVVSNVHQSQLTSTFNRRRTLSESHRLRQFVSMQQPPDPEAPTPAPDSPSAQRPSAAQSANRNASTTARRAPAAKSSSAQRPDARRPQAPREREDEA